MSRIIAPVSRHLDVSSIDRSVAFYRDALGFDVNKTVSGAELVSGPARITLGNGLTHAADRSILFFETDDVESMHTALAARGAKPSEPADANWIKMRMFEVRDPDGNVLWFGRSFGGPNKPVVNAKLRKIMPELPLTNVAAGVAHYRDVLGFSINYQQDDLGVMDRDDMRLLLIARTEHHTGIGSCCFYVMNADDLHAELVAKGANVLGAPVSYPWGLREFKVLDLEGNRLSFAQTFE